MRSMRGWLSHQDDRTSSGEEVMQIFRQTRPGWDPSTIP